MKKKLHLLLVPLLFSTQLLAQPDWAEDIACIVYSHCSNCHSAEGIAPFNLMNYTDAFNYRNAIETAVSSKAMPPWSVDQDYNPMAHANVLTAAEIALVQDWVSAGAPEGDPSLAPDPPVITTSITITDPDLVLTLPEYTVPAISEDIYKCFVIPTNVGSDKHITAIEIIPGNRNIVHHVVVYQDATDTPGELDDMDPTEGYTCFGGTGSPLSKMVSVGGSGAMPLFLPEGMGIPLTNGNNIVVQMHYPLGSTGEVDQTSIHIKFADNPMRDVYNEPILNYSENINEPLILPPEETKTFYEEFTFSTPVTVIGIAPHAHLTCTSIKCDVILPTGDTIPLIDVPVWDFNWQNFYSLKTPIVLPAGSKLLGEASYDNTSNNPNNPNDPPLEIVAGESTTDEMMAYIISWVNYETGDENIVVEGPGHYFHDACEVTSINDIQQEIALHLHPNPIKNNEFFVEIEGGNDKYQLEIIDFMGRVLHATDCMENCTVQIPSTIPNGMYFCRMVENERVVSLAKKIIIAR